MDREDHSMVAIPARSKSLNIIVEHGLGGPTLYLHKGDFVSGGVLDLDIDSFCRPPLLLLISSSRYALG